MADPAEGSGDTNFVNFVGLNSLMKRKDKQKLTSKYYRSIIRQEMKQYEPYTVNKNNADIQFTNNLSYYIDHPSTSTASFQCDTSLAVPPSTTLLSESTVGPITTSLSNIETMTVIPPSTTCELVETTVTPYDGWSVSNVPVPSLSFETSTTNEQCASVTLLNQTSHLEESLVTNLTHNLRHWAIENHITQSGFSNLLNILKKVKSLEELNNLPCDCRTLLKTDKTNEIVDTGSGHYYHFGLSIGLLHSLENQTVPHDLVTIYFDINIDGLPLSKSSGSQFWPVLGSLCLGGSPFIIGVWHGYKKPSQCNEILETFIKEYLNLKKYGFVYKNQRKEISLSKIICDAPAKSFILCIKGHNSYFGCTKCITEGTYVNNRVSYTDINSALRTDNNFRAGLYEDYHNGVTPLLQLEIDLVKNVPLDYMHLVCLGVMKRLLQFWIRGNMSIRMKTVDIENLNQMILDLKSNISYLDFSRLPRSLHDFDRWKATEFRLFLLYTGPILLKDRLKPSQYMHFLSLNCAIRILCHTTFSLKYNSYAKVLLEYFVRNYSRVYGEEYVSHNVHNLIHLSDDVLNFGSLDNFSAFKYENYMGEIKKCLKTCNKPLQQFINRVNEKRSYQKRCDNTFNKCNIVSTHISTYNEPLLNGKLVKSYKCVQYLHFKIGIEIKHNHCLIKDSIVIKVNKIIKCQDNDSVFLIYQRYLVYENSFVEPCESKKFYGGIVKNLSSLNEIVTVDEVVTKCIQYDNYVISFVV